MEIAEKVFVVDFLFEVAEMQNKFKGAKTKRDICDICVPFRDKYSLTDLPTLQLARKEFDLSEMLTLAQNAYIQKSKSDILGFVVDGDALRCKICNTNVAIKTAGGFILSSNSEGDEEKGICNDCLVEHCLNTHCFDCDWYKYPDCPHIETKKILTENA